MANYYYVVSGLPTLTMEENKSVPSFANIIRHIEEELAPQDIKIVNAMRLPVDNKNLVNILESKDVEFDTRGCFSQAQLSNAVKSPEILPAYMRQFLEAHKENRQLFAGLTPLDQLSWLFYDEMAESRNTFLKAWFEFDLGLRNVAVGLNVRKNLGHIEALATERDRPGMFTVIGRNDVAEAVLRSAAPDFGLSAAHPWVEKVVALSRGGLTEMERGLDDIRWAKLDELTAFTFFQAETIAAFIQKLMIVERWMKLDPVAGRGKLDRLVEELRGSFVMPAGF
ncbi:MAG: DUF2764 domain-containing protein [Chitinispirillales bacterium]|jgi:hypothetical protein|nr:DUF2764 domain-containing protein [Chitinispirillales bacterium]